MRINRYIAHHSKYSRREADELLKEGRVSVGNSPVRSMGYQVKGDDRIFVDRKPIKPQKNYTAIIYHKQRGELVTKKDPLGRTTVFHTLSSRFAHFIAIGRLDFASEGLLLLTDAPRIAHKLMNSDLERVYNIKINGTITQPMLEAMEEGIVLEGKKGAHLKSTIEDLKIKPFGFFEVGKNTRQYSRLKVGISEGKNRELRRFFAHFNREVLDLKRVSFGAFNLNNLPSGKSRYLSNSEYSYLRGLLDAKYKSKVSKATDIGDLTSDN